MMDPSERAPRRAGLLARLRAGGEAAWLPVDDVATVWGVDRSTVDGMVSAGALSYRLSGGQVLCDPGDVLAEYDRLRPVLVVVDEVQALLDVHRPAWAARSGYCFRGVRGSGRRRTR